MSRHLFNYLAIEVKLSKPRITTVSRKNGDRLKLLLYPISDVGANLDRTAFTLRQWEAKGWIPKTPFRIKKARHYTRSQIQLMTYLSIKYDVRKKNKNGRSVGLPMPQAFIDELFDEMTELNKFILEGQIPEDMYQPEMKEVHA